MLIRRKLFLYPRRKTARRGPERNPDYLAWVRTLDCAVCGQSGEYTRIEAAHTNALGPRGMRQKSSDYSAIPLCYWHHQAGPEAYHKLCERRFSELHQIDLPALVATLNDLYRGQTQ